MSKHLLILLVACQSFRTTSASKPSDRVGCHFELKYQKVAFQNPLSSIAESFRTRFELFDRLFRLTLGFEITAQLQIFVNKRFTTTLYVDVNYSNW